MIYFNNIEIYNPSKEIVKKNCDLLKQSTIHKNKNPKHITAIIEQSRIYIANSLKISPSRLFFTPNITISNNIATNYINQTTKCIITSEFEPKSTLKLLENKAKQFNIPIKFVNFLDDSSIDWQNFKTLIRENPNSFVALSQVHPKTGRFLPIKRISDLCKKTKSLFLLDISLTIGKIPIDLEQCPIDFVSSSSQMLGTLQGASIIYIAAEHKPQADIVAGNENFLAVYSFAQTLEFFLSNQNQINEKFKKLKNFLFENLNKNQINYQSPNIEQQHFLQNFVNLHLPQIQDIEKLILNLELNDIYVSNGSLLGLNKNILLTFSHHNKEKEIKKFCDTTKTLINKFEKK